MERWHRWVLALGVLGMVGFVGSLAVVAAGWLGIGGYLGVVSASLASYAMSLLIGHLGDLFEFRRRYLLEDEQATSPCAPQVLESAWWADSSSQELGRTASSWAS